MSLKDILKNIKGEWEVVKGDATKDKEFSSKRIYKNKQEALEGLERARQKLFNVNSWSELPGVAAAGFVMYTPEGEIKESGTPEVGDYIYIDLPGPTPETWVRVIDRKEAATSAEFTVSPSPDPREKNEDAREVEHFFSDKATSTFKVALQDLALIGYEIGKNEGVNNGSKDDGRGLVNTLVALGGWMLFQELQWNKLTDYLVHHIETDIR